MMKYTLSLLLSLVSGCSLLAQVLTPDLQDTKKWKVERRNVEPINENGFKGIRFAQMDNDGLMILKDVEFTAGTIEFDVKGENLPGRSFVGIAFHLQDPNTFDAIYFRPFNFLNPDTIRRSRAVQYISTPDYGWEKLRLQYPGKYESKINPVPDPDGWFHVRVEVDGKNIRVFVNKEAKPALVVEKISTLNKGKVALWVGNGSGGSFANLTISQKGK